LLSECLVGLCGIEISAGKVCDFIESFLSESWIHFVTNIVEICDTILIMESNRRVIKIKRMNKLYPPYWDEMLSHNARIKNLNHRRRKRKWNDVYSYQYRRFRTWKHNRKNKWK